MRKYNVAGYEVLVTKSKKFNKYELKAIVEPYTRIPRYVQYADLMHTHTLMVSWVDIVSENELSEKVHDFINGYLRLNGKIA